MLAKSYFTRKLMREGKRCLSLCRPQCATADENYKKLKSIRRTKGCHYLYDPDVAGEIARTIRKESDNVDIMIEINPGIGVLSTELAKLYNRLILIENKTAYLSTLQKLKLNHENIEFEEDESGYFSFGQTANYFYFKPPDILNLVPKPNSPNDIVTNIFSIVPPHNDNTFTKVLTNCAMTMQGMYSQGRLSWFALVPSRFRRRFQFVNSSYSLILKFSLDLFMDVKFLMELDMDSVVPPFSKERKYGKDHKAHLIKITPKPNMNDILKPEEVEMYQLFAKQMLRSPDKRVISRMEELFPKCGIHLIDNGFHMMQSFQELKAEEFLQLYKCLPNIPDYEYSLWRQYVKNKFYLQDDNDPWADSLT